MSVDVDVLILPAFDDLSGLPGEATPWKQTYDLTRTVEIPGVPSPLRYGDRGLAVVPTGIGKTRAATTTTALWTSDRIDLSDALVCSVGVAGAPPALPVGSVLISETIVDWDDKCRFDPDDGEVPLAMNPYTDQQGIYELDAGLVESAREQAATVDLASVAETPAATQSPDPETGAPKLQTGTNLCGDELWHGRTLATQAEWLTTQYDADPYRVTEMEDAGTATALSRFGALDQYLSIRGVSNHDRPNPAQNSRESFFDDEFEAGFQAGIESAVAVADAVVADRLADVR